MLREFKEFAIKGNAFDLAVGVIIGVAFGGVVTSLVNDILMPPLGMLTKRVDFAGLYVALNGETYASLAAAKAANAPVIAYGAFLNAIINFILVAFAVFLLVKQINRLRRPGVQPPPPATRECPYCVSTVPIKAVRCPQCTSDLSARVAGD